MKKNTFFVFDVLVQFRLVNVERSITINDTKPTEHSHVLFLFFFLIVLART